MKKSVFLLPVVLFSLFASAQVRTGGSGFRLGIGLKAGVNFANVSNASSISASNRTGFMFGAFLAPGGNKLLGFRSELIFSRQGYDYKKNTNTGSVNLDYILLPQLITIGIGKHAQLQAGGQVAFLLNARVDSSGTPSTGNPTVNQAIDFFNRFDYGAAIGAEIYPARNFIIGARYNISLSDALKTQTSGSPIPIFTPDPNAVNPRNNVVQLFLGYKF